MDKNTSPVTSPSQGDQTSNPQPNVGNSTSHGDTSTLEALQAKIAKLEEEAFKTREKERQRKEAEQTAERARLEQLQRNGEFEQLTQQQQKTIEDLKAQLERQQAELAQKEYEALRARVATKHGLPPELATRLVGTNEAELDADAQTLKNLVPVAHNPGNSPNPRVAPPQTREDAVSGFVDQLRRTGKYGA